MKKMAYLLFAVTAVTAFDTDPAKCVQYTAGDQGKAGTWKVLSDKQDNTSCLAETGAQYILGWAQASYPDHLPAAKTWWAKRMSDTGGADTDHHDRLYFGGRPAVRDLKSLYEAGFDAVLSMEDAEQGESIGIQPLPTTSISRQVAAEAGLLFHALPAGLDFTSTLGVDEITNFLEFALAQTGQKSGNGPLYVFDKVGFKAAAALQLFRARKGLIPKVTSKTVTERATKEGNFHGITFPAATIQAIAREAKETISGTSFSSMRVLPDTVAESLTNYHWLKYLYNIGKVGVFDGGQLQQHHVSALKKANIKVIINMRQGSPTMNDVNNGWDPVVEEPVTLLNLDFQPLTKGISDPEVFLANASKKALILDDRRPASWVCSFENASPDTYSDCVTSTKYNFETKNTLEWGDAGQNARAEGETFKKNGIVYYHLPVGTQQLPKPKPFNATTFAEYAPQFIEAVNIAQKLGGHVLFHCTIGYRTGAFPVALLAIITKLSNHDTNMMMHSWGYDVEDEQTGHVFEVGTSTLFKSLPSLSFDGTADWDSGRIAGSIYLAGTDKPASTTQTAQRSPSASKSDNKDSNALQAATLIFAILAFVAAITAVYLVVKKSRSGYTQAAESTGQQA